MGLIWFNLWAIYMDVIWLWYGLVAFIAYPYHVFYMGLIRIWYKSIHIPYDLGTDHYFFGGGDRKFF
jgi:hypothetical protein